MNRKSVRWLPRGVFALGLTFATAPAVARDASPTTLEEAGPENGWQLEIAAIRRDYANSGQTCLDHFERYARSNRERSASAGFLGVGSGLTFWGTGEELHYTEVIRKVDSVQLEYQIGFGYVLFAKQRDARIDGNGVLFGLPANAAGQAGITQFSASIIGIAPDSLKDANGRPANCKTDDLDPESALLCALDMQPTVTQAYYQTASGRMSAAFERWRRSLAKRPVTPPAICPQVINFRKVDRSVKEGKIDPSPAILAAAKEMNDMLAAACLNPRPNARISYKSGLPELKAINGNVKLNLGDGGASAAQSLVAEGYYRTKSHLATISAEGTGSATSRSKAPEAATATAAQLVLFDQNNDHYAEFTMNGLKQSSKLPSILASIITMEQSDEAQRLRLQMACSGGSVSVPQGGNPVTDPVAFTNLVFEVRKAVDNPAYACQSQFPAERR
ncbi:hypothetical protein [Novosphingobium sp. ST904]|uniref:hypothetical protein n=1 Tax=Novosphingobium sp. ST904 TaxID=1684385 RepID=UPI00104EFA61|nr:hypothetical protein [Novosphingobium sp. ST904]TCM38011.1 hypothetical protein EDF59_10970 [Novosphingobium sp. ST904]